jgi:hypothetical protein
MAQKSVAPALSMARSTLLLPQLYDGNGQQPIAKFLVSLFQISCGSIAGPYRVAALVNIIINS